MRTSLRTGLMCVVLLAVGARSHAQGPADKLPDSAGGGLPQAPAPTQLRFDRRSPVVQAVERVKDAVVNISSTRLVKVRYGMFDDEMFERFFGLPDPFSRTIQTTSLGSGVVIHPAGYVLTNAHVVARATEVTCSFSRDQKFEARIVSAAPASDLAVLKINAPRPLPHLPMGRSEDLMIGETVIAIGNAMGYAHTVTTGVVSALNRKIPLTEDLTLDHLVQTDASINPGNSGGPLLNINGELVGINAAIRGDAQNIGFAIPIDQARRELAVLLDFTRVNDVQFGAMVEERDGQLLVKEVSSKSPAAEGGLAVGDIVVAVDGRSCPSLIDFDVLMMEKGAGQTCRFRVARKDRSGAVSHVELKVQVLAAPRPDGNELLWARFGLKVRPVDADVARQLRLRPGVGLVVTQMSQDSPADKVGIQVGDVLFQVEKFPVSSLDELGQALKKVQPGQTVRMGFVRGRFQLWTPLKAK